MKKLLLITIPLMLFAMTILAQDGSETSFKQIIQTMEEGWNTTDGEKFASVFAEEHDYIVWNGYYMPNLSRIENGRAHQKLFENIYPDVKIHFRLAKVRHITPEVALIHVLAAGSKNDKRPADPTHIISMVLTKNNDEWNIKSFHNLDLKYIENEEVRKRAPLPPQEMYAAWYENE